MNLIEHIQNCFAKTHPEIGNHRVAACGQPYVVYAIVTRTEEDAREMLLNAFRVLGGGCALQVPEGVPFYVDEPKKKYLYWRQYPIIEENKGQWERAPEGYWVAYCRALVSEKWAEEGQVI